MTIAAGFACKEGILICADREEASGASKKVVQKALTLMAQPYNLSVAAAGSAPASDLAVKRLGQAFFKAFGRYGGEQGLEDHHEETIVDVLTKIHEDHIWRNQRTDHAIRLIIGLTFQNSERKYLYVTEDNIPQPISRYCCVGYGEDLCTYFSERLYHPILTKDEVILLAAFIFREVNSGVQFCGKGTDMIMLSPRKLGTHIYPNGVEEIQRRIPEFAQTMTKFWESIKNMPNWVSSVGQKSTKVPIPAKKAGK